MLEKNEIERHNLNIYTRMLYTTSAGKFDLLVSWSGMFTRVAVEPRKFRVMLLIKLAGLARDKRDTMLICICCIFVIRST